MAEAEQHPQKRDGLKSLVLVEEEVEEERRRRRGRPRRLTMGGGHGAR